MAKKNPLSDFYNTKYTAGEEIQRSSKLFTLQAVPDEGEMSVLDVGCGAGVNSLAIAAKGHKVQGVDLSPVAIEKYREKGFEGKVADLERALDFEDNTFDLIFCSEVIEHLNLPEVFSREIFRILKPGGSFVVSTPNSAFWIYRLGAIFGYTLSELQHPKHFQFFSCRSLSKLLLASGFEIEQRYGRNIYLLIPGPWANDSLDFLQKLGMKKEIRFRTKKPFYHWSNKSRFWNSLFADTLIMKLAKPG